MPRGDEARHSGTMLSEDTRAWAALAQRALPAAALVELLRAFGGPAEVLTATPAQLRNVVPDGIAARLTARVDEDALARAYAWLEAPDHRLVAWGDEAYPKALLALGHAPPALYYVGNPALLNAPAFAIVGSRNATAQGKQNARDFAHALSDADLVIVSGLALGIDGAAHEGALEGRASTVAVVGTGLDRVYPARHRALAHRIAERGGLLSEFPPGTPPREYNFPRRNRLISGLARGVLVVEATLQSGSLITARYAGEQGRDVFAIPGSIHSPLSRGCHKLIREGAKLVETARDVLEELGLASPGLQSPVETPMSQNAVLQALGGDPADFDALVARTGLGAAEVAAELTNLEIAGDIASLPGGKWQRTTA